MPKIVLLTFVTLGLVVELLDARSRSDETLPVVGITLGAYTVAYGMGEIARRRETGAWLGLRRSAWLLYPVLAWVGGVVTVLAYKFAWPR